MVHSRKKNMNFHKKKLFTEESKIKTNASNLLCVKAYEQSNSRAIDTVSVSIVPISINERDIKKN